MQSKYVKNVNSVVKMFSLTLNLLKGNIRAQVVGRLGVYFSFGRAGIGR